MYRPMGKDNLAVCTHLYERPKELMYRDEKLESLGYKIMKCDLFVIERAFIYYLF